MTADTADRIGRDWPMNSLHVAMKKAHYPNGLSHAILSAENVVLKEKACKALRLVDRCSSTNFPFWKFSHDMARRVE